MVKRIVPAWTFLHSALCSQPSCTILALLTDTFWVLQDKLTASEQLGDLLRQAGDNEAALTIFQKANVPHKVIEGLAAKGDFAELSKFSASQVGGSFLRQASAQYATLCHCSSCQQQECAGCTFCSFATEC